MVAFLDRTIPGAHIDGHTVELHPSRRFSPGGWVVGWYSEAGSSLLLAATHSTCFIPFTRVLNSQDEKALRMSRPQ